MFKLVILIAILSLSFRVSASAEVLQFAQITKIHDTSEGINDKESLAVVSLAPDKFSIRVADREIIYDFSNNYQYTVNHEKQTYDSVPIYYIINFRGKEKQNREFLNELFKRLEKDDKVTIPKKRKIISDKIRQFDLEMAFSIGRDSAVTSKMVQKTKTQNTSFFFNGKKAAEFETGSFIIPAAFKNMYFKYILYTQNLHPFMIEDHLSREKLFEKLNYTFKPGFEGERRVDVAIQPESISFQEGDIKIPVNYREDCSIGKNICELYYAVKYGSLKISEQQFINEIKEHLLKEDRLSAFLTANEYMLQYGVQQVELFKKIISDNNDEQLIEVMSAIDRQNSKESTHNALTMLEEAAAQNTKKGYVLYIFMANHYSLGKFDESYHYMLKALQKNPFIVGAYVDLSRVFFEAYDTEKAWFILDLAYKINPEHYMNKGAEILKDKLRQKHPEYF
ncbi:hypothetical protein NF27_DP01670 [Candidatus Jidaibacter acanthamoeba]|uniref:Uncharacterized protein n=1 Tax=Candidatus Jidaibacter acanthamoebae TaxID=86105 RepID=A0A0C1QNJ4_9RICK|nr:hypothetical protein [Candidatus Jidaibacter acanthamoeba]KIE05623.1 hypothetical protein NF27_DP01670 [Candidatus Jidaibacter acanthamoeba]